MFSRQENTTPENKKPSEEGGAAPSKTIVMRQKLALLGHYVMLGLAPVIAVVALVIAVLAVTENESSQEQLNKTAAKIEGLSASLSASKGEIEKLRAAMAHEKNMQDEQLKSQSEKVTKIIQNLTPMQVKMRISPTIEEQLRPPVSAVAPAAASAVAAPATSGAPKASENTLSPQAQAFKKAIDQYNKH